MHRHKILAVTGSRADYGLLYWVMREIEAHPALQLQVAVTGMHLSAIHGDTWREIERDGFAINARIETLDGDDSAAGITRSVGRGVIGFAGAFAELRPDFVLLLGDRFEILAAAQAALLGSVPIAHIAGGDVTEGAVDDAMRHAITKMAHLHFATNASAAARIKQMGEHPERVFDTGSPGIDYLLRVERTSRPQLEATLGMRFRARNVLVTFHPETLAEASPQEQVGELLGALEMICSEEDTGCFFTLPNADLGGSRIASMIDGFVARHANARAFASLGSRIYLSLMAQVDAVIGNSSSGFYEAPSLKVPTVNVGGRQQGRIAAASVLTVPASACEIAAGIRAAYRMDCAGVVNPYGDGNSAKRIVELLAAVRDPRSLLRKSFHDAPA